MTWRTVATADHGRRLDAWLRGEELPGLGAVSQRDARRLCELGALACAGVQASARTRLRAGDAVDFAAGHAALTLALGIPVVFAAEDVVVVHKPAGLAVHGGPLVDTAVAAALQRQWPGAGLAHRLDRQASGLLLAGLRSDVLQALAGALERGAIERRYLAIVHGAFPGDQRTIDLPLRIVDEPRGDRPKAVIDAGGQRAVSHTAVVARRADATLVSVTLETGRTHQIRAHLAAVGHPLLGDPRYGDAAANQRAYTTHGIRRTMLHATLLRFQAPRTGSCVVVTASHPADFARLFPALRTNQLDA